MSAGAGAPGKRGKPPGAAAGKRRRKPEADGEPARAQAAARKRAKLTEEISSESEPESPEDTRKKEEEDEELEETAQEKKLRLAKLYLEQLRQQEEEKAEEEAFGNDQVAGRLKEDVLEQRGRLQKLVAKEIQAPVAADIRVLRGHQLSITCLVITPDNSAIFSGAKDCTIIKWSVESGKKLHQIQRVKKGAEGQPPGHVDHILCMAISSDGKYLATGDKNKLILIWDVDTCRHLFTFTGHRDAVSGLAFRKGTHQLYSTSHDRSVKVWNVAENAYIETLFGHQDAVTALDGLSRESCVTAGGRDGTVRVWKIPEESQLVFYGHQGSIDCIQLINEEHMISGSEDGSLALWGLTKKRPLTLQQKAHGMRGEEGLEQPYWVSSVTALLNTDLVASGSHSSFVRLWQCAEGFRKLQPLWDIPLVGFINSLKFSSTGDFLVAGVGKEHRLGRWWQIRDAKNSVCIIPLRRVPPAPAAGS
ncbi:U3 small nucleolar RNA-interacting protein 2 [Macrotis lagotis]|uniref:U3 small nucleolar RNA-interacting protein 2 n=1 Tax=Macrotis lagotis TaxID=92651 RepID=UPI003D69977C